MHTVTVFLLLNYNTFEQGSLKILDAHVIRGTPEQCTVPALGIAAANRKPCYWLKVVNSYTEA